MCIANPIANPLRNYDTLNKCIYIFFVPSITYYLSDKKPMNEALLSIVDNYSAEADQVLLDAERDRAQKILETVVLLRLRYAYLIAKKLDRLILDTK